MRVPSHTDAFQVLLLQLADDGRGKALLGGGLERACAACAPFLVGTELPSTYLEFPLAGEPFLDVTLLYDSMEPGARVRSEAAAGTEALLDWYAGAQATHADISFGFELDTSKAPLPQAAIHFQPRAHTELVEPFFAAAGEPERARLYLDLAARMPDGWRLAFCGMFRGRPSAPLRVCGYLGADEKAACTNDPARLVGVFDAVGFTSYDDAMIAEVRAFMAAAPGGLDFQFDVYPDGHVGDVFALDIQFEIARPAAVRGSFEGGPAARVMELFQARGMADKRWRLVADAAFARALPVERDDGSPVRFFFTLMPQWTKARWSAGILQPAKLYYLGCCELMEG